jgi:superfamily II DNA or RNA helicase
MSFVADVSKQIARSVQQLGDALFRCGAVQIADASASMVCAMVRGERKYRVLLYRANNVIDASCTCPSFEQGVGACKHIWATLRAAEADGYLQGFGGVGHLRIATDADDEWKDNWDDDPLDDADEDEPSHAIRSGRKKPIRLAKPRKPHVPAWKRHMARLAVASVEEDTDQTEPWPVDREVVYVLDVPGTLDGKGTIVEINYRERKANGDWSRPRACRIWPAQIASLRDPADQQILSLLAGAKQQYEYWSNYYSYGSTETRYVLSEPIGHVLLPRICQTGRCCLRLSQPDGELLPIAWDDGGPWEFWVQVARDDGGKNYIVSGSLRRGDDRMPLSQPVLLVSDGVVFAGDRAARLDDHGAFGWIALLREHGPVEVPVESCDELLAHIFGAAELPRLDLPDELRVEECVVPLRPRLRVRAAQDRYYSAKRLIGELSYEYDGLIVPERQPGRRVFSAKPPRLIVRDWAAERAAAERLRVVGFRVRPLRHGGSELSLAARNLPRAVRTLVEAGWHVEAEGKLFRQPGQIRIEVSSGIDWFELHGQVEFGDTTAKLPALLAALRRGDNTVRLDDGTFGMLPETWLKKYGILAGLGTARDGHLRFTRSQVGLLDALLASQPDATCDAVFAQARDELRRFDGIQPADTPAEFIGNLRGYQREGLGWLYFLERFGFGGCLADDMGLGKTVQVLALLESRRALRAGQQASGLRERRSQAGDEHNGTTQGASMDRLGASLVVVPRSLVFNWKQEAARFAPKLRILDHTGAERAKASDHFGNYDAVLTTYGTLRRDAIHFKDVDFDYVILDEAQAVKNAATESAKAARLLRGRNRLALSGTPIENHLGELWSLFEFLNPGMLGSASVFRLGGAGARNPDEETRRLLAHALRPFILRRTKDQVARDLPSKLEQTMYCELEPPQRKLYEELRDHYRRSLLKQVERDGINKSKIQILEALLRLRQAAIHPGLIDKSRVGESSAKLDMLLPQLGEVLDEGHKALVFSQFTSMLAIVRNRLDLDKVRYEYLDGRTRDRAGCVERFQNDPNCKLFLISLKAGGLGLNLTAAEYVFLLDPWWNPAVEAQAIDRTHRIGQHAQVFAYRLIARHTVEEKVLELQQTKRNLADAIINADNSLIRKLAREDLELLLS